MDSCWDAGASVWVEALTRGVCGDDAAARPAAGTINACVTILKEWGVKRIKVLAVIASKQGTLQV